MDVIPVGDGVSDRSQFETFGRAMFHCFLEEEGLAPIALAFSILGAFYLFLYLLASAIYGLMFDPDAREVAARLDMLSIRPEKWVRLS